MSGPPAPEPPRRPRSHGSGAPAEGIGTVLSTIAAQARRTNLVRLAEIGAALDRAADGGLDRAGWAAAERTAHQLAGSAGTFGFVGVSELARSLERFFAESGVVGVPDAGELAAARSELAAAGVQLAGEPGLA